MISLPITGLGALLQASHLGSGGIVLFVVQSLVDGIQPYLSLSFT